MTDQRSNGRKERAVYVFKANNKFLLISFDKLESEFIFFFFFFYQNQGFKGRTENNFKFTSVAVISAVNGNFEELELTSAIYERAITKVRGRLGFGQNHSGPYEGSGPVDSDLLLVWSPSGFQEQQIFTLR